MKKHGTSPTLLLSMAIGKRIGSSLYVHREYANQALPFSLLKRAEGILFNSFSDFSWDYVKFDSLTKAFVFTKVDDFNNTDEPIVKEQVRVVGSVAKLLPRQSDPFIIHGKHLFVAPDYKGFDYQRLRDRFLSYQHLDKKRMGRLSWWLKNYLTK